MKSFVLLVLLFSGLSLFAQSEEARALHEKAKVILQQPVTTVLDRLEASYQLQKSQILLSKLTADTSNLKIDNRRLLKQVADFFSSYQNSDSLLLSTRFYPDSVFQRSPLYTDEFKTIAIEYFDLRYKIVRKAYNQISGLKYRGMEGESDLSSWNFDYYWTIEVWELEQWLQEQELAVATFKKEAQNQLILSNLQLRLDAVKQQVEKAQYELNKEELQKKIESNEQAVTALTARYQTLRNIGVGVVAFLLLATMFIWRRQKLLLERKNYALLEEKKRSEDLLLNILPAEIVPQLKENRTVNARLHESTGILFTDFQNFSQISKNLPPKELVKELDYCFTHFDQIIDKHRLQKIKTIGDAYMCAGGLYTKGNQYLVRMIKAALEIQEFLNNRKLQRSLLGGYFFNARIGIHVGTVVTGVVGTKKIAFDIWGDTVNVAQQMEQYCEVGNVNISSDVFKLVVDTFECIHSGTITAKNGQVYDMYKVVGYKH